VRVIEQARLSFREGNSDKIYELDLVEVATNQYVVNFRFGRRNAALKDGTKTPVPVDLPRARSIFQKLVDEKTAGGYRTGPAPAPAPSTAPPPIAPVAAPASTNDDLLARLRQGLRGSDPLGPVVWKVTDRDLTAAEPTLRDLLESGNRPPRVPLNAWRHTLVAALVRCGTRASLPTLDGLVSDARNPPHIRDVARLAIARIAPDRAKDLGRSLLHTTLAQPYDRGDAAGLARAAEQLLSTDVTAARLAAVALYVINDPVSRAAVVALARIAKLTNQEAGVVRALFRLAEIRRDGDLYAFLAHRIENNTGYRPFGPRTRAYLKRRVARVLRRLGRAGSPDYVAMASSMLISIAEADAQPTKRGTMTRAWYDRFARYHAFNQILYANSTRYKRGHHGRSFWECSETYQPDGTNPGPRMVRFDPSKREEAFPALWDAAPDRLWRLVAMARTTPVAEFSTRALKPNKKFIDALPDNHLAAVLSAAHPLSQRFAFDAVRTRPMTAELARAALASEVPEAHAWMLGWIQANPALAIADAEMIALLVTGRTDNVRQAAFELLGHHKISADVAKSAAVRSIAILMGLRADVPGTAERAAACVVTLLATLDAPLRDIEPDVLHDLIAHPLAALGELAGELMLRHARRDSLPADLLEALLASPHPSVRLIGGRMLALTPAEIVKDDLDALVLFATSANKELRIATRGLVGEIARRWPDIGRTLAGKLIHSLCKAQPDGAPSHVVSLLRGELAQCLPTMSAQAILRLVGALSPHARDAGGMLLAQLGPDDLGLDDIARLAGNEVLAVRQGAWALAKASMPRYRLAPVALARLVDTEWQDSRDFAIGLIRDMGREFGPLPADAIIAICDSIRPEVQELGKGLLREQFSDRDAHRYLTRLAEHPSVNLQLLVSTLLDQHVAGNLERLQQMTPYLVTVLSQVNRGQVAKQRAIALLRREAAASAAAAAVVAPILDRQSATIAVTQKQPLIATMVDIHHAFPDVELPIDVTAPARHTGDR